jgi:hypothetical protein
MTNEITPPDATTQLTLANEKPQLTDTNSTPQVVKKTRLEIARQKASAAVAMLQKLEAQANTKASSEKRRLDTRKKVLLGAYLLEKMESNEKTRNSVLTDLDQYLSRPAERALFDLPAERGPFQFPAVPAPAAAIALLDTPTDQ